MLMIINNFGKRFFYNSEDDFVSIPYLLFTLGNKSKNI